MANSDNEVEQPIIIKKVKKGGHGHHGGAWKVAYADFVTAMMAFFLLMWLLNATTEEQKNAISNYFDPTHPRVSSELSGSGGILGGLSMAPDGAQVTNVQSIAVPTTPTTPRSGMAKGDLRDHFGTSEYEGDTFDNEMDGHQASDTDKTASTEESGNDLSEGINIFEEVMGSEIDANALNQMMEDMEQAELAQLEAMVDAFQNQDFEDVKEQIIQELNKAPELADLMDNLMIDITPEGLRIQIIDNEGRSMFPSGSANMFPFMRTLIENVTQVIVPQPNQISVRGHTDGQPYPPGATYNNWNLSSDRAIASQRVMLENGLTVERVQNVVGKADREHLLPDEPLSPRNRRISVILLREELDNADDIRQAAADAIRRRQEQLAATEQDAAASAAEEIKEDRENIPELENTIEEPSDFFLDDAQTKPTEEEQPVSNDPIADEIRELQRQNQQRGRSPLPAPRSSTPSLNQGDVLEFP